MFDFKSFRKLNKWSQIEASLYFGVTQGFISQLERGISNIPEAFISKILADSIIIKPNDLELAKTESGIPLIPISAIAGFANGDVSVMGYEIKDRYVIPEFDGKGVSFLIKASGGSMYPKYSNGDILACRPVTDLSFFQWGKVYVLDTDQGPLVKRLFECKDDDNCIYCHSDNKDHYPPFKLRKDSIRKIAIVVGVIRLE